MKRPKLKWVLLTLFLLLNLPVLAALVAMNFLVTENLVREDSQERIASHQVDAVDNIDTLFREISTLVEVMATSGRLQPPLFQNDESIELLANTVRAKPEVISAYVAMAGDGRFFQARRMLPGQSVHGEPIPTGSQFARRSVRPQDEGIETYVFQGANGEILGRSSGSTPYDPRKRRWYQVTQANGALTISDPEFFAALSLVGFTIAAPFDWEGSTAGVVAIDLTLDGLSRYLADRTVSPGSIAFVLDAHGNIIANSLERIEFQDNNGRLRLPHVTDWADPVAGVAYSQRNRAQSVGQTYFLTHADREYAASLQPISTAQEKAWQVFVVVPMDDFNASIKDHNLRMLMIGIAVTVLQVVAIWFLARRMATPLEELATCVQSIRELKREPLTGLPQSQIREIAMLTKAVEALDAAIRTFASFVPVGLVRELLQSDQEIVVGGSSRFLTVFFSDIEGFSDLSEAIPAQELLERVSEYLSIATSAVDRAGGTVDKFIGDGVMAFWGAPSITEDHALRACIAANRMCQDIDDLNHRLAQSGRKPLNVRIGIHSDAVVVGNIGSPERLNYTVLGDGVNVAARLETLNKRFGTRVCISHAVYREAGDALCVRPIGEVQVKGRRSRIVIYELMGIFEHGSDLEPSEPVLELSQLSWKAYEALRAGDSESARDLYESILQAYPDDTVARGNLAEIEDHMPT